MRGIFMEKKSIFDYVYENIDFKTDELFYVQLRSLFTAYCIINGVEADTFTADSLCFELYSEVSPAITYDEFENYMYELIC